MLAVQARHVRGAGGMQAIASLSRGVGVALQGVVRGVVNKHTQASEARTGDDPADSRLGEGWVLVALYRLILMM